MTKSTEPIQKNPRLTFREAARCYLWSAISIIEVPAELLLTSDAAFYSAAKHCSILSVAGGSEEGEEHALGLGGVYCFKGRVKGKGQ